jgi:hypothetical protein
MVTPAAKREPVAHLRSAFGMTERRACRVMGCVWADDGAISLHRAKDTELQQLWPRANEASPAGRGGMTE